MLNAHLNCGKQTLLEGVNNTECAQIPRSGKITAAD